MVGQSPYSASKISADQLAISYYRSFGLPVKIVRPFNTYGPRQSARAIIPTIICQLLNGQGKIKLGNTTPTRDFVFVKDAVNGFIEIHDSEYLFGETINIGTNTEISIGNLTRLITRIMDKKIEIVSDEQRVRPDKSEVERLVCNNRKILEYTNWKPEYDLESGLYLTIEWTKQNVGLYKSEIYNI